MTQKLIILGTGGSAHDVLDTVEAINAREPSWDVVGFLDDSRPVGSKHLGFPVLGCLSDAGRFMDHVFINVIGSDKSYRGRPEIIAATGIDVDRFATLAHPQASVSGRARLGRGVSVHFGVSVGGGAVIGDHVTLCPGSIVGHDATIDDYTILAPGSVVSGFVTLGRCCYIGARAVVRQQLQVGEGALVGMGAVVVRDVEPDAKVIGNPARVLARQHA
jgi:sugar O-acyltransferase (sialic acid O-acetyltransferase NeuD family)